MPKLINRTSYGNLAREAPVYYEPPFASVSLTTNPKICKALAAQVSRPDLSAFTSRLHEKPQSTVDNQHTRFWPLHLFNTNEDILAYGQNLDSLETIVLNSVLIEPFKGPRSCPYCPEILDLQDATDILNHIMEDHQYLLDLNFSCPSCLKITILNKDSYLPHYLEKHAGTTSLMMVLNETHVFARTQYGHVLSMFITMGKHYKISAETIPGAGLEYVSTIGGYTTSTPESLAAQIDALQQANLPPCFQISHPKPVVPQPQPQPRPQPQPQPQRNRPSRPTAHIQAPQEKIQPPTEGYYTANYSMHRHPSPGEGTSSQTNNKRQSRSPAKQQHARHPFSRSLSSSTTINLDEIDTNILDQPDDDMIPPNRFNTQPPTPMDQSVSIDDIISTQN